MKRTRLLLILDIILFLSLGLSLEPRFEGLAIHEWLGLALVPLIVVHLLYAWRWIAAAIGRLVAKGAWRLRFNVFLNTLLFIAFVVTVFSGAMTSFIALPALGIPPGKFEGWLRLHNQWQAYLGILVGLHIAMNLNWIVSAVRQQFNVRATAQDDATLDGLAAERMDS